MHETATMKFPYDRFDNLPLATNPISQYWKCIQHHGLKQQMRTSEAEPVSYISGIGLYWAEFSRIFFRRLTDFLNSGGVFGGRIFFGGFSAAGQNSADPDIRRRLGTLVVQYMYLSYKLLFCRILLTCVQSKLKASVLTGCINRYFAFLSSSAVTFWSSLTRALNCSSSEAWLR